MARLPLALESTQLLGGSRQAGQTKAGGERQCLWAVLFWAGCPPPPALHSVQGICENVWRRSVQRNTPRGTEGMGEGTHGRNLFGLH